MAKVIHSPTVIAAEGTRPKRIEEFIGNVNSGTDKVSLARMKSASGWKEPGQTPQFDEYTLVLAGQVRVETKSGTFEVNAGEAFIANKGEWVRYSTPGPDGAEYVSVCLPAFSPATVNRD